MMIRYALLAAATLMSLSPAQAGGIPKPGDFYLISRDRSGLFVGSHKLYLKHTNGLKPVRYCNRPYFVRSSSVAWTQVETELGRNVQIEFNFGRGWRPICERPQDQVALEDIGIEMSAKEFLQQMAAEDRPQSRLSKISGVLNKSKENSRYKSYHTR